MRLESQWLHKFAAATMACNWQYTAQRDRVVRGLRDAARGPAGGAGCRPSSSWTYGCAVRWIGGWGTREAAAHAFLTHRRKQAETELRTVLATVIGLRLAMEKDRVPIAQAETVAASDAASDMACVLHSLVMTSGHDDQHVADLAD